MAELETLMKEIKDLRSMERERKQTIFELEEERRKLILSNIKSLLVPYIETVARPVTDLYRAVYGNYPFTLYEADATEIDETRNLKYNVCFYISMYGKILIKKDFPWESVQYSVDEWEENFDTGGYPLKSGVWFSAFDTVEKINKIIAAVNDRLMGLLDKAREKLTAGNLKKAAYINRMKEELKNADKIEIAKDSSLSLTLNGIEYICTPKTKI